MMRTALGLLSVFVRSNTHINHAFRNNLFVLRLHQSSSHYLANLKTTEPSSPMPSYLQSHACQSVESVLSFATANKISQYDSVSLLKTLRVHALMKNVNIHELMSDSAFHALCNSFISNCHRLKPPLLVSGLRSLFQIGVPPDSVYVNNVERVILKQIGNFDVTQLISCLHLHTKYQCMDVQKQVVAELVGEIQKHISEIQNTAEVLMLIETSSCFGKDVLQHLEKKMVEVIGTMDASDLIQVICAISESSSRNKTLLSSASHFLCNLNTKPNLRETLDVLHALNSLKFYDSKLLSFLTENRETDIALQQQPTVISALLTVCGHLKWRHHGVMNACAQWIKDHFENCGPRELVAFVLTSSALNYPPQDYSLLQQIASFLNQDRVVQKDVWLDFVWSCAVLNYVDKNMLLEVLSPEFHQTLLDDTDFGSVGTRLKLMNLKYVLQSLHPENVFSCGLMLEPKLFPRSKESEACHKDVLNALNSLVPKDKFMQADICTYMGVTIDAEFVLNKKGKPLALSQYGLKDKPTAKTLPRGAKRIALMIWLFRDYTLNERCLTGVNDLAVRLLTAQGYAVVQVPYHEFVKHHTEVKKVVYLSQLLSEAVSDNTQKL